VDVLEGNEAGAIDVDEVRSEWQVSAAASSQIIL
jgi:hypothetical protein